MQLFVGKIYKNMISIGERATSSTMSSQVQTNLMDRKVRTNREVERKMTEIANLPDEA